MLLVIDSSYERWNKAIAEYFLKSGRTVYLSCDRSVLEDIPKKSTELQCHGNAVTEFTRAVINQISPGARDALVNRSLEPLSYVGILAFHVYCFYQSEDRGDGKKGFWSAYARELGLDSEKSLHPKHWEGVRDLWVHFKDWLDEQTNLRYGQMNAFKRDSGAWHVVNIIKSHAGLRAADLKDLPKIFLEKRLLPDHAKSREILENNIQQFVDSMPSRARELFKDVERRRNATLQILDFYGNWDGSEADKQAKGSGHGNEAAHGQFMWCQILYKPERSLEGALLNTAEPLTSVAGTGTAAMLDYLETGFRQGLLTAYNPITGRYEEARSCSEGDWVLFFFPFEEYRAWRKDLSSFAERVNVFRGLSDGVSQRLKGLPTNIAGLLFWVKDNPGLVPEKWLRFYSPIHYKIRLEGGLRLERGRVWLDGAPPQIHCDAGVPEIKARTRRSDEDNAFKLGSGEHRLINAFSTVHLEIRDSRRNLEEIPKAKWVFKPNTWPTFEETANENLFALQGAHYQCGVEEDREPKDLKPEQDFAVTDLPMERAWIDLNLKLRGLVSEAPQAENLLCKVLDMRERLYGCE